MLDRKSVCALATNRSWLYIWTWLACSLPSTEIICKCFVSYHFPLDCFYFNIYMSYIYIHTYAFLTGITTSVSGTTYISLNLRSSVFSKVFIVQLPALGWLSSSVFSWATPLCALPIMCHFVLVLWLLSSEREIPPSSVWMRCFPTLPALCCRVSHPMRARSRRGGLTIWLPIGWPRRGGACRKEGLQLYSNRV